MSLLMRKRTVLAKIEDTYGTDPTPTGTDNAMLVRNLNFNPIAATQVSRDTIKPYLGASDTLLSELSVSLDFEIELAGSGTPGVAPAWASLLKACGFGETLHTASVTIASSTVTATVTETAHGRTTGSNVKISGATESEYNGVFAITVTGVDTYTYTMLADPTGSAATGTPVVGTNAQYDPLSASIPSITLYFNVDGVFHKVTGARGTVDFTIDVKNIPVMKFNFTGIYNDPSDASAPSCVFTGFQIPKVANTTNTPSFSLFSYSGYLQSINLNLANDVQHRVLIGYEEVKIVDRKPSGTFVFEAPTIASKDFFAIAKAGTTGAMSITHGIVSGNKVTLSAPRVSLGNPNYSDSSGVAMLSVPFTAAPSSGNDDIRVLVA